MTPLHVVYIPKTVESHFRERCPPSVSINGSPIVLTRLGVDNAVGVRMMLKRTEGIVYADASYERKEAVVKYDPTQTTEKKILAAITSFGYGAKVK